MSSIDPIGEGPFGSLFIRLQPDLPEVFLQEAVAVLHNDVLPFYAKKGIPVSALLMNNGQEFCGTEAHPYELYLELNEVERRRTKVRSPRTNGFVERFNNTVLNEFFSKAFRSTLYESVGALQDEHEYRAQAL